MKQVEGQRLFPQDELFWEMLGSFKYMLRVVKTDIQTARWYTLGYKWGWQDCLDRDNDGA